MTGICYATETQEILQVCKVSFRDRHDFYSVSMGQYALQALKDSLALTRISLIDFLFQ